MPTELTADLLTSLWTPYAVDISPNGRRVAWSAQPNGKEEEHTESAIFVAALDGPPRRWTHRGDDKTPRWSPDGTRIAFLSDRKERGTSGLYLLPSDGGEAEPLVVRKKGIEAFAWSPDGGTIAFIAADEPDEEDERREKERDDPAVYGERLACNLLWIVNVASGEVTRVDTGDLHVAVVSWSPDGARLAYVARKTPELDASWTNALYVRPVAGGEPRMLCEAPWAATIAWAEGTSRLVFDAPHEQLPQAGNTVWAIDENGGEPVVIGSQLDDPFCSGLPTAAVAGERRALVLVTEGLTTRLEWRDPDTGEGELVCELGDWPFAVAARQTPAGLMVASVHPTRDRTYEVHAGSPSSLAPVSNHHEPVAHVEFGPVEDFTWQSADGLAMDGVLIRPPHAAPGRLPTVVLPHGGPYWRSAPSINLHPLTWGQWLATAGYAVLMPNYRGGLGHGSAFAKLARADMGGAEFGDVMAAVDEAVARGIADPDRLAIGGWSQGGFLTAWAVTQTDRFKAAIMGAGISDWGGMSVQGDVPTFEAVLAGDRPWDGPGPHKGAERSPLSYAAKVTTPLLILHGEKDERVPLPQATGFHRALLERGATVRFVTYPREGHGIAEAAHQRHLLAEVRAWLAAYL